MSRKHWYLAIGASALLLLLLRKKAAAATSAPPIVEGTVTVGGRSLVIDDNVLSDTFGLPIEGPN